MPPNAVTLLTADDFLARASTRKRSELVRGEIRMMTPASGPHGVVAGNLYDALSTHVRAHRLGRCFPDGTGFALSIPTTTGESVTSDTVRSPDVAFVRADRLPPGGIGPGFLALAPDLAVEVLSPSDTASDLEEKLADYRAAGTPLVWVVDPVKRLVTVLADDAPPRWLRERDTLDGGAMVPGFACRVIDLFEGLAPR